MNDWLICFSNTTKKNFVETFINKFGSLLGIKTKADRKVLIHLCNLYVNEGRIALTPNQRKIMQEKGLGNQSISNSIRNLKKAGLIDGNRGDYTLATHIRFTEEDIKNMSINSYSEFKIRFLFDANSI